jgi:serine/threonine-protein kinase
VQQHDGLTFLLKQKPKNSDFQKLNYSAINLDSSKFAIPISVWEDERFLYEALSYREGWSLAEIIHFNEGGIGGQLIESWTFELLKLLEMLHTHNPPLIYRDLKPDNILVTPNKFQLVLLDLASVAVFSPDLKYDTIGTNHS